MIFYVIMTFLRVLLLAGGLHIKDCKLHKDMLHKGMSFIEKKC